ncbi:hypothetical protein D0T12_07310 [Actinomadura spongiicola]|uniref:Glycosyltransferase RgtA/B/C/D-like domain-containing protein n=1 Tax=Actinomadura spongiicola TaxID=2303421 RepID=A0A372GMK1_9ACTN|nr:hypothetical protein [Actinomadura spongiicola]RFS86392.1 hypothetical protein D0T12_07310 [Actinomadura spongiicola]
MRSRPILIHLPFACLMAVAVVVRVVAVKGYPSPLWFGDSPGYLTAAIELRPSKTRPSGYSLLLWALKPFHSFTLLVSVQHVIGLLMGVLVYLLVWRVARVAWFGALLAVPVLLPVHQVALEHMLMSDSLFAFLLLAAVAAVLWRRRTTWWLGALAGLFTGFAAVTRAAGLPLIVVILVAMVVRGAGWRVGVAAVAFAVPVGGYVVWFHSAYGEFRMAKAEQVWLYGRTATFADCRVIKPRPELKIMCPERSNPRVSRPFAALWTGDSPFRDVPGWIHGERGNALAGEFAREAIKAQPGDYAKVVVHDTLRAFEWRRVAYPTPWTWRQYEFPEGEAWSYEQATIAGEYGPGGRTKVVDPWSAWVLKYQERVVLPGTVLGVLLLGGLGGVLLHVRSEGRWRVKGAVWDWTTGALLPWGTCLALLVIPAATADFDYRYVQPAVPFACVALAFALFQGDVPKTRSTVRDAALPSSSGQNRAAKSR